MTRIKRGVTKRRRHKKLLKLTKGHHAGRHNLFRQANESMLHALSYAYAHRKEKKGDMRRLWIIRVGAAAREHGISYSQFIHGLKLANIDLDRKALSDLAMNESSAFAEIAEAAKAQLSPT